MPVKKEIEDEISPFTAPNFFFLRKCGLPYLIQSSLFQTLALFFFISHFIVPPVLLQTISTLMSLLMACRKCSQ